MQGGEVGEAISWSLGEERGWKEKERVGRGLVDGEWWFVMERRGWILGMEMVGGPRKGQFSS